MALAETIAGSYLRNTRGLVENNLAAQDQGMTQEQWNAWYQEQLSNAGLSGDLLAQAQNNPYGSYQAPALNYFERLWKGITGVSAKEQDFYNQRQQAAQEYLAQLQDAQRQQAYNDPAAQMAREKAAGLNPELSGGQNISSGDAAAASPDDTPPNTQGVADEVGQVGNIVGLGFSLFQNAFSVIGSMQQIYGNSLNNSQKELALTDQGWNQLVKLSAESSDWMLDGVNITELGPDDQDRLVQAHTHGLLDRLTKGEFSNMYDRKTTRKLMKRLESILGDGGSDNLAYRKYRSELMKEIAGNTTSAAEDVGRFGFSDNIFKYGRAIADTFGNIEKMARQAKARLSQSQANRSQIQEGYEAERYTAELGEMEATAGVADAAATVFEADERKERAKLTKRIDKALDDLIDLMHGAGDAESLILLFMLNSMRGTIQSVAGQALGNAVKP